MDCETIISIKMPMDHWQPEDNGKEENKKLDVGDNEIEMSVHEFNKRTTERETDMRTGFGKQ